MTASPSSQPVDGRYYPDGTILGEGNFGVVYSADHYAYGLLLRKVAVKVAKSEMTEAEARKAFPDGLRMGAVQGVAPPHLRERFVTVYDVGISQSGAFVNHPFIAMEYVEGQNLKKLAPLPLKGAIAIFDQILEAIGCMHQHGYIHRDLKPSNILVTRSDEWTSVKVTDFGLVQSVDSVLRWAASAGDMAHLAPEAFQANLASPQTDVYMLGLLFYEMLTGYNPFARVGGEAKGDELAGRHRRAREAERFERLERHEQMAGHPELAAVVRKALSHEAGGRFLDAGDFRQAWEKGKLGGGGGTPRPVDPREQVCCKLQSAECLGLPGAGEADLAEAMAMNKRLPNSIIVGRVYLRQVEILLARGNNIAAWNIAYEGNTRRKCQSTFLAMVAVFRAMGDTAKASDYSARAVNCPDKD